MATLTNHTKVVAVTRGKFDNSQNRRQSIPSLNSKLIPPSTNQATKDSVGYKTTLAQCQKRPDPKVMLDSRKNSRAIEKSVQNERLNSEVGTSKSQQPRSRVLNQPSVVQHNPSRKILKDKDASMEKVNQTTALRVHDTTIVASLPFDMPTIPARSKCNQKLGSVEDTSIHDVANAVGSVQEAWDKFAVVSRVISRLECLMVLTKIDHVLNDEYLAQFQQYPFSKDSKNDQSQSNRTKMESLKEKIMTARDLEGSVKKLSATVESYKKDVQKLMEDYKTAISSRRRFTVNNAAAIREQLLGTSSRLKAMEEQYLKSSADLETIGIYFMRKE